MKFEFPDTGEGVTEGQFLQWLVEEGEEVEEDQAVAEVETDKAVVDIPAPGNGTIKELLVEPGDTIEVGEVILEIDVDNEEETELDTDKDIDHSKSDTSSSSSGDVLALPKVRHLAAEKGVDLATIKTGERITEEEVLNAADSTETKTVEKETQKKEETVETEEKHDESAETVENAGEDILATPAVRKLAREKEVDIQGIDGSGRGGKVTRDDVLTAAEGGQVDQSSGDEISQESKTVEVEQSGGVERVDMSNVRKTVADRMAESRFTAPHVTHVEKADITKLVDLREEKKEQVDVHLTYMPFIMKALVDGLKNHPNLNAELDEEKDQIVRYKDYNFNIAVDTENGLMMPRIDGIDQKSILTLAEEIGDKAEKAQNRKLSPEDLENGTFTITNLGVIGGEEFTPIINYPQVGILGIGKIQETAEVVDGEVVPRKTVKLSLSYDHRVVDGADAAKFMNDVVENLENPEKLLMSLGL
jgi:pyruvate dehydrogenase E2 component (dihydrolipoamide acetyltransferase)